MFSQGCASRTKMRRVLLLAVLLAAAHAQRLLIDAEPESIKVLGDADPNEGAIAFDSAGNIFLGAGMQSAWFGTGYTDATNTRIQGILAKLSPTLEPSWTHGYLDVACDSQVESVAVSPDDSRVYSHVAADGSATSTSCAAGLGYTPSAADTRHAVIVCHDTSDGSVLWFRQFSNTGNTYATSLSLLAVDDGVFAMFTSSYFNAARSVYSSSSGRDAWFSKYAVADGSALCETSFGKSRSRSEYIFGLSMLDNTLYTAGKWMNSLAVLQMDTETCLPRWTRTLSLPQCGDLNVIPDGRALPPVLDTRRGVYLVAYSYDDCRKTNIHTQSARSVGIQAFKPNEWSPMGTWDFLWDKLVPIEINGPPAEDISGDKADASDFAPFAQLSGFQYLEDGDMLAMTIATDGLVIGPDGESLRPKDNLDERHIFTLYLDPSSGEISSSVSGGIGVIHHGRATAASGGVFGAVHPGTSTRATIVFTDAEGVHGQTPTIAGAGNTAAIIMVHRYTVVPWLWIGLGIGFVSLLALGAAGFVLYKKKPEVYRSLLDRIRKKDK